MKKTNLIALLLLLGLALNAQEKINDQWLVILSGAKTYAEAHDKQADFSFDTQIIYSGDYDNLNPGWYINCISSDEKQDARAKSKALKADGFDNYVKYSGSYIQENYLLDHHYLVLNNKYLYTGHNINPGQIKAITGVEKSYNYVGKAIIDQSILPMSIQALKDKEFVVYDAQGNKATAKVTGFIAVNIVVPHFGTVQGWNEGNTADQKIAEFVMGKEQPEVVAVLEALDGFEGVVAHRKGEQEFQEYKQAEDKALKKQALEKFFQTNTAQENDVLLKEAIKEGRNGAYQIIEQAHVYQVGDTKVVYFSVGYGEFGGGSFFTTIMGTWNAATDKLDTWELSSGDLQPQFIPLIIGDENHRTWGLLMLNNSTTYFNYPDWNEYRSYEIHNYDCGF